jgi:hypothetical protein
MGLHPANPIITGTLGTATGTVPTSATPNPTFPGISGGGIFGDTAGNAAPGGTSKQNLTNPGNFSGSHH